MAYEKNRRRPPQEDDGTLIEGRNAVLETLRSGRAVDKIFLAEGAHLADVAAEAKKHGVPTVTCDRRKLDHMSVTGTHQGVIAQTAAQEYVSLDDIFRVAEERGETPLIVVCDGIEDPHNLGAIIRSAETAGAHGVIIPKRRAVGLTASVARSAAGALAYVGVHKANNLASTLDELKERGVWLFGAEADGTVDLYEAPFDRDRHRLGGSGPQPPDARQVRLHRQHSHARPRQLTQRLQCRSGPAVRSAPPPSGTLNR